MLAEVMEAEKWSPFAGPGHYNDPDMLIVGNIGWGNPKPTRLTHDEQYTHISLWCLLNAPLLIGCDMDALDDFTLNLLTNDEILAVDQDRLCQSAKKVNTGGPGMVFSKTLADGSLAVGLFNTSPAPQSVVVHWTDLGISGKPTL
jgi:alpha-galactosidase